MAIQSEYQVGYNINVVSSPAIESINSFVAAVEKLSTASNAFKEVSGRISSLNSSINSLARERNVKINTTSAVKNISALAKEVSYLQKILSSETFLGIGALGSGKNLKFAKNGKSPILEEVRKIKDSIRTIGSGEVVITANIAPAERAIEALNGRIAALRANAREGIVILGESRVANAAASPKNVTNKMLEKLRSYITLSEKIANKPVEFNIKTDVATEKLTKLQTQINEILASVRRGASFKIGTAGNANATETLILGGTEGTKTPKGSKPGRVVEEPVLTRPLRTRSPFRVPDNAVYRALGPSMIDSGGLGITSMLKSMGLMYGIMGLGSLMGDGLKESADYNNLIQTTKNILAPHDITPDFEKRFKGMEKTIRNVGVETKFTAPQVADASKFLAMAGLNLGAIKNSIRPIADIALVGDNDLASTADVVTNIMTSYKIDPKKMRKAADIMTQTFTLSNTTLMDLAESFKYSGSILHTAGVPFETAAAAMGVLGDAGRQGSLAGTDLRMILSNISKPNKGQQKAWDRLGIKTHDKNGDVRPLEDIFQDLHDKKLKVSDFYSLFRITAAPAAAVLTQGIDKFKDIISQNYMSDGMVGNLANAKKNTVQGLWYQMTSQFTEDFMKAFETQESPLRAFLKDIIGWLGNGNGIKLIKDFAAALMDVGKWIWDFTKALIEIYKKFSPLIIGFMKIQMYLTAIKIPLTAVRSLTSFFNLFRAGAVAVNEARLGITGFTSTLRKNGFVNTFFGGGKAGAYGGGIRYNAGSNGVAQGFLGVRPSNKAAVDKIFSTGMQAKARKQPFINWAKGSAIVSGLGSLAGGLGGMYLGNKVGESVGGTTGGMIGSMLGMAGGGMLGSGMGSALPLIMAHPIIAAVVAASIAAVSGAAYLNGQHDKAVSARIGNDLWMENFRLGGVESVDMNRNHARMIAYMRIYNNQLTTTAEKWKQINKLANSTNNPDTPSANDIDVNKFTDTEGGKAFADIIKANDVLGFDTYNKMSIPGITSSKYGSAFGKTNRYTIFGYGYSGSSALPQLALAQFASDKDKNLKLVEAADFLEKQMMRASSFADIRRITSAYNAQYHLGSINHAFDNLTMGDLNDMTYKDISQSRSYVIPFNQQLKSIYNQYRSWGKFIWNAQMGHSTAAHGLARNVLGARVDGLTFNNGYEFGSKNWAREIYGAYMNPGKYGANTAADIQERIQRDFSEMQGFYSQLPEKYKMYFTQFLDQSKWSMISNINDLTAYIGKIGLDMDTSSSKLHDAIKAWIADFMNRLHDFPSLFPGWGSENTPLGQDWKNGNNEADMRQKRSAAIRSQGGRGPLKLIRQNPVKNFWNALGNKKRKSYVIGNGQPIAELNESPVGNRGIGSPELSSGLNVSPININVSSNFSGGVDVSVLDSPEFKEGMTNVVREYLTSFVNDNVT